MILTTAIAIAIAAYNVASLISLVLLTFIEVNRWFQQYRRTRLTPATRSQIGFTMQDYLSRGEYRTVQGVFNTRTGAVEAAREIASRQIDQTLAGYHNGQRLVVYP